MLHNHSSQACRLTSAVFTFTCGYRQDLKIVRTMVNHVWDFIAGAQGSKKLTAKLSKTKVVIVEAERHVYIKGRAVERLQ